MNRTRITIACPAAHTDDANHLAMALGLGSADAHTYTNPSWQDASGNLYAAENKIAEYVAVDRTLTSQEQTDLTAYLEGLV